MAHPVLAARREHEAAAGGQLLDRLLHVEHVEQHAQKGLAARGAADALLADAFLPGSQNRSEEVLAAQASTATGAPSVATAYWTYPREMDPNSAGAWGTCVPLSWFLDSYPAGDYRKEVTVFTTGQTSAGKAVTFAPHSHPHSHKFRPTTTPGPQDVNHPSRRYPDVLLMYAEALNEQGQTAAALTYVNQVRARARNGTGARTAPSPPTSRGWARRTRARPSSGSAGGSWRSRAGAGSTWCAADRPTSTLRRPGTPGRPTRGRPTCSRRSRGRRQAADAKPRLLTRPGGRRATGAGACPLGA